MFQLQNTLSIILSRPAKLEHIREVLADFYPQCFATPLIHLPHCDARLWCLLLNIDGHLVFYSSPIKNEPLVENAPSFSLSLPSMRGQVSWLHYKSTHWLKHTPALIFQEYVPWRHAFLACH